MVHCRKVRFFILKAGTSVAKGRDVPRDVPGQTGTGRPVVPLSRDKKVSLSRRPFIPGQKSFACPAVPLSRDMGRNNCPGTNSSVPGQNEFKNFQKKDLISCLRTSFFCFGTSFSCFRTSFSCFRTSFSVSDHLFPVLERPFLLCPVLSRVPSRILAVPPRPVPWPDC